MARKEWLSAWALLGFALVGARAAWAQTICNGHGSFSNGVCTCATGYAGASCNQCASNYVGYPNCGSICGDVNDDGAVNASDVTLFRAHLASPTGSPFSTNGAAKCTVAPLVPTLPPCDILDVVVIRRSVQSPPLLPPRGPDCPFVSRWSEGEMLTYTQNDWSNKTGPGGTLLQNDFATAYAGKGGVLQVGASSGFEMLFDGPDAVQAYLPQSGLPAALTASLLDPTGSSSGVFGGSIVTLQLDVDFYDDGFLAGTAGLKLGDLLLCNAEPIPSGTSVRSFLAIANTALGGGSTGYMIADLDAIAEALQVSFSGGTPSVFAEANVFAGACP